MATIKKSGRKPKYEPLDTFDDYNVNTDYNNPELVRFGCGDVKVSRKDLIAVADLFETQRKTATFKKKVAFLQSLEETVSEVESYDSKASILSTFTVAELAQYVAFFSEKINAPYAALLRLHENSNGYKTINDLLEITPETYRRLAATPKDRTC